MQPDNNSILYEKMLDLIIRLLLINYMPIIIRLQQTY